MNNINPQTASTSAYERVVNLDRHLLSCSNSSLFGGGGSVLEPGQQSYSLFSGNTTDWTTVESSSSTRSRIPPIENLSIIEINQIQEGLKKLFGIQYQGQQVGAGARPNADPSVVTPTPHSPLVNYCRKKSGCGISTCRTPHCATAQESRSRMNISSPAKDSSSSWANNLNNSWPIMDTDFTYSIGPNVQRQLEKSVIYSTAQAPNASSIQTQAAVSEKTSWSALPTNFADIPTTPSAGTLPSHNNHQSLNRDKMRCVVPNFCRSDLTNDPTVFYRFYQFECACNKKIWFSPLAKAKDGLFCWACTHFVKPFAHFDGTTPYQGSELCYGKFECHVCKNTWSSRRSMANVSEKCFGCGASIYPYYQVTLTTVEKKKRRIEAVTYRDGLVRKDHCNHCASSSYGRSSPRACSPKNEITFLHHNVNSSRLKPITKTHGNLASGREPGIGTPTHRNRLKKSPLTFSISSPAIIQKLKKDIS